MDTANLDPAVLHVKPAWPWNMSALSEMYRGLRGSQGAAYGSVEQRSQFDLHWIRVVAQDPVVTYYESEDALRFGPRAFSSAQMQIIRETVEQRRPLPEPPLPLDD